jgi:hypothetical protein
VIPSTRSAATVVPAPKLFRLASGELIDADILASLIEALTGQRLPVEKLTDAVEDLVASFGPTPPLSVKRAGTCR